MKIFVFVLVFLFAAGSLFSQQHLLELEKAYKSDDSFNKGFEFFMKWHGEYNAITDAEYEKLPEAEKEVYNIFGVVFRSQRTFNRLINCRYRTNGELYIYDSTSKNNYQKTKDRISDAFSAVLGIPEYISFFVIQDDIDYSYVDTVDFHECAKQYVKDFNIPGDRDERIRVIEDSLSKYSYEKRILILHSVGYVFAVPEKNWRNKIINFRPKVDLIHLGENYKYAKILYQSSLYDTLLNRFLRSEKYEIDYDKRDYLNKLTPVVSYFGLRHGFVNLPKVESIVFLGSYNKAMATFDFWTSAAMVTGNFILEKKNGEWEIVDEM